MNSVIKIDSIEKHYPTRNGALHALSDVNLDVRQGEFVSLLGPSGCGKSTLLRIIDGLTPHEGGVVSIDGVPVTEPGPDRAMVFQHFSLIPWATVLNNVAFPLEIRGVPTKERVALARDQLAKVGLDGFEDHYPRTLSGGMQQRVGIARALVVDPDILLMDEPFGALDSFTRTFLQDELLRIWSRDKKTVVFVTHSIDEAVYLSDRVATMTPRPGTVAEVFEVPLDRDRTAEVRDSPHFVEAVSRLRRTLRALVPEEDILGL